LCVESTMRSYDRRALKVPCGDARADIAVAKRRRSIQMLRMPAKKTLQPCGSGLGRGGAASERRRAKAARPSPPPPPPPPPLPEAPPAELPNAELLSRADNFVDKAILMRATSNGAPAARAVTAAPPATPR